MSRSPPFAVVGGGASGIAAAWLLSKLGFEVEVVERARRLGGRIGSCRLGDRPIDLGGKNIGKKYHLFREFAADMGSCNFEHFGLNSCRVENGNLMRFDARSRARNLLSFLAHCPARDSWRFLRMLAAVKMNEDEGYLGGRYFSSLKNRLGAARVSEVFGERICQLVMRPILIRTNGAEPDEAFVDNLGSNLRMILDSYEQLQDGMKCLLDRFEARVPVRLETTVEGLLVNGGRVRGLRLKGPEGVAEQAYSGVVLATPAATSAKLLAEPHPDLAETLRQVRYFPVGVMVAEYSKPVFNPDVRALVFDDTSGLSNAGAYGLSDLNVIRYTFSGGRARRLMDELGTGEELLSYGEDMLGRYLPIDKAQRVRFVSRHYREGLCAFAPDYQAFMRELGRGVRKMPGLHLTGDYIRGASIEACFRAAQQCVDGIVASRNGSGTGGWGSNGTGSHEGGS